jgi:hypothetical protein
MSSPVAMPVRPRLAVAAGPAPQPRIPWGFAEVFVISQTALPALLYLPGSQAIRLPIRLSAYAISLVALAWQQADPTRRVPAARVYSWVVAVMALLGLMMFHPDTASLFGGVAHAGVYLAVMAPVFWAPTFVRTPEHLARLLWILLLCSGVNSLVGVLQVYDPIRWLPREFSSVLMRGDYGISALTYVGAAGETVIRPPGLFDTPGAVAGPAMFAALLGVAFAVSDVRVWKRGLSLGLAGCGLAAIYLSQVRVSFVVALFMLVVYALVLVRQGRFARASQFAILGGGLLLVSFSLALTLGGQTIFERFHSLVFGDPIGSYQRARGAQLYTTFSELLFERPLGAGLARWGMIAMYFGSPNPGSQPMWAEIQFTGWMIDGGVVMIALYVGALLVTAQSQLKLVAATQYPRLAVCAAVVFAASLGPAVMTISFTPFVTQIGIQYWFLAGALHGVACRYGLHDV